MDIKGRDLEEDHPRTTHFVGGKSTKVYKIATTLGKALHDVEVYR